MREVTLEEFARSHAAGAMVVDVREFHEYVGGHVPGATLIPMREVSSRLSELPGDKAIYVICASGNRSFSVTGSLMREGYDAHSVAGGTGAWVRAGHPVEVGPPENAS